MSFVPRGSPVQSSRAITPLQSSRAVGAGGLTSPILGTRRTSPPRPVGTSAACPRQERTPLARNVSRMSLQGSASTTSAVSSTTTPISSVLGAPAPSCYRAPQPQLQPERVRRKSLQSSISQPQLPKTLDASSQPQRSAEESLEAIRTAVQRQGPEKSLDSLGFTSSTQNDTAVFLQEGPPEAPGRPAKDYHAVGAGECCVEVPCQVASTAIAHGDYQAECPGRPPQSRVEIDMVDQWAATHVRPNIASTAHASKVLSKSSSQSSIGVSTVASTVASRREARKRQESSSDGCAPTLTCQAKPLMPSVAHLIRDCKQLLNSEIGSASGDTSRRDNSRGGSVCTTASADTSQRVNPSSRASRAASAYSPRGSVQARSPRSPIGSATVPSGSGTLATPKQRSIQTARERHSRSVSHLRSLADLVKDLEDENKELKHDKDLLLQRVEDLQVKHDAAQSHLDHAIIQQQTPRTRRSLEAQARLLQPSLGKRMATSFVEARHLKTQKEKAMLNLSGSRSALSIDGIDPELDESVIDS